jgi:predicted nucleic-acid-binding protein
MRAFLDTNVLIDFLKQDRPSAPASTVIWEMVKNHRLEAFVTTQSILDMFYVVIDSRQDREAVCRFIHWMIHHTNVDHITSGDLMRALDSEHADFEDNAQLSYAETRGCDVFVTNDRKILNRTDLHPMRAITPEQFVEKMRIS